MKKNAYLFWLGGILLMSWACNKEALLTESKSITPEYLECPPRKWDTLEIESGIYGDWQWVYSSCERGARGRKYYNFRLEPNHTLKLVQNNGDTLKTTWKLDTLFSNTDFILLAPALDWTMYGRVMLCDQVQLSFGRGPEICDNFFRRKVN
jgi:hypothetical protein